MNRFEYILDAGIHYLSQQTNSYDYTVLFNKVNILHTNYESELLLWIVCQNENEASNIADVINTDVFIFMLDESLRDTQFKNTKVDSLNLELLDILPPTPLPTPAPTMKPTVSTSTVLPTVTPFVHTTTTTKIVYYAPTAEKQETDTGFWDQIGWEEVAVTFAIIGALLCCICCTFAGFYLGCLLPRRKKLEKVFEETELMEDDNDTSLLETQPEISLNKSEGRRSSLSVGSKHGRRNSQQIMINKKTGKKYSVVTSSSRRRSSGNIVVPANFHKRRASQSYSSKPVPNRQQSQSLKHKVT